MSVLPACGPTVLSSYGARYAVRRNDDGSCQGRDSPHDGADFGPAEIGDDVIASADGVVVSVTDDTKYGTEVVVRHNTASSEADDSYRTGYLHLRSAAVHVGQRIARGQKLGEVGLFWGSDEIVHVHWRLWSHGKTIDPVSKAVGCFERSRVYSDSTLALTFPLRC